MTDNQKLELQDEELIEEMEKLEEAVRSSNLPLHKQLLRSFLSGLSWTIGTLVVAAVLIPLAVYLLKDVHWIPMMGTFIENLSNYMQKGGR